MTRRRKKQKQSKDRSASRPVPSRQKSIAARSASSDGGIFSLFSLELRKALIALLVAAVLGVPLWIIGGTPTFSEFTRLIKTVRHTPASDSVFTILVADLAGDDSKRTETRRLARALQQTGGVDVHLVGRALGPITVGSLQREDAAVTATGQEWLLERNGDVLVWGEVTGKSLLIGFVSTGETVTELRGYASPSERLELPREFISELGVQIQAVALSLISPATQERTAGWVARSYPVARKLRGLMLSPAPFPASVRATVANSFGLIALAIGERTGEAEWILQSADAFRRAMEATPREEAPYSWAALQINLGNAHVAWSEYTGQDSLEVAVIAFRAAADVMAKENAPIESGMAVSNLARLLWQISERSGDQQRLEEAIQILQVALSTIEKDQVPPGWAGMQLNLGLALGELGEMRGDKALLQQAIEAYRSAIDVFHPSTQPTNWGIAQSNLASTLISLGEQQRNTEFIREAVQRLRNAVEVSSSSEDPGLKLLGTHILATGYMRDAYAHGFRTACA